MKLYKKFRYSFCEFFGLDIPMYRATITGIAVGVLVIMWFEYMAFHTM